MNLLGMIGGTSWHSTVVYYKLLNELVGEKKGKHQNPPLLLYSLNVQLMREQNRGEIEKEYRRIASLLEEAGAGAIIFCANTPHMVFDFVQPQISVPILHIADAIGAEARRKGFNKLGLLGTKPTMQGDFIQKRLEEKYGIYTITPTEERIDAIHNYIADELTQGKFSAEAKTFFLDEISQLNKESADAIILGCTELPMLLEQKDTQISLLDTTLLHAKMAVDFILEE